MAGLGEREWECVRRYVLLLAEELGDRLIEVRMFGSAARGDMWPEYSPMHSDIDLLVITSHEIGDAAQEAMVNDTYPFYLEYGRQLSPHFLTSNKVTEPPDDRMRQFLAQVERDGIPVWPA